VSEKQSCTRVPRNLFQTGGAALGRHDGPQRRVPRISDWQRCCVLHGTVSSAGSLAVGQERFQVVLADQPAAPRLH
jgi:hypothetical protein